MALVPSVANCCERILERSVLDLEARDHLGRNSLGASHRIVSRYRLRKRCGSGDKKSKSDPFHGRRAKSLKPAEPVPSVGGWVQTDGVSAGKDGVSKDRVTL